MEFNFKMTTGLINFTNNVNYPNPNYGVTARGTNSIAATNIFSVDSNQGIFNTFECTGKENVNSEFEEYNSVKMKYINGILSARAGLTSTLPSIYPNKMESMIDQINEKAIPITESSMDTITLYCFDNIQNILNDSSKTDAEKEKEIQVILDKMEAVSKEAIKKIEILQSLMKGVSKIASITMGAGKTDYSEAFSGIEDILSQINTDPSSLSEAETSKEVEKSSRKNLENILGTNKSESKEKVTGLNNEIKNLKATLKDSSKTDEEKLNTKVMIASLEAQKEVYSLL